MVSYVTLGGGIRLQVLFCSIFNFSTIQMCYFDNKEVKHLKKFKYFVQGSLLRKF